MKVFSYLIINERGSCRLTKGKPSLNWNEISIIVRLDIPEKLFERPLIEASIKIDENIVPKEQPMEVILNTKELIEESTGAKIDFKVIQQEE